MNRTIVLSAALSLAISGCATQGSNWEISRGEQKTSNIHDLGKTPGERMLEEERSRKEEKNLFRDRDVIIFLAALTAGMLVYDLIFDD